MINEIKLIVKNYLNNAKLCEYMTGTVETGGIRVSDKLVVPNDLIVGNLKTSIIAGQKVRLLRNQGGQQFYILEVMT
jgi:hypothetical protein